MSKHVKYGFVSGMLLLFAFTAYKKLKYDYFIKNGIKAEIHNVYRKNVDNYVSFFFTADSNKIFTNQPINSKKRVAEIKGKFPKYVYYISKEETAYVYYPQDFLFDFWFKRLFVFGFLAQIIFTIVFLFKKKGSNKNATPETSGVRSKNKGNSRVDFVVIGLYFCSLVYFLYL